MNRFGVFSPLVLREDMPSILMSQAYSPDSRNVRIVDGYMSRVKMRKPEIVNSSRVKIPVTDGNPILKYATLSQQTAGVIVENLFAFTKAHAYRWRTDTTVWQTVHSCSGDCTAWSVQAFNNKLIATNNLDVPIVWSANETPFAPLDSTVRTSGDSAYVAANGKTVTGIGTTFSASGIIVGDHLLFSGHQRPYRVESVTSDTQIVITESADATVSGVFVVYDGTKGPDLGSSYWIRKAAHVTAFENHIFFGRVVTRDSGGTLGYYLGGIVWSDLGDELGFDITGTGDAGSWNASTDKTTYYLPGADYVSGFGETEDTLLIFKEGSIHSLWSVATDLIWSTKQLSEIVGCKAPDSIVMDPNRRLFFLATDMSIREIRGNRVSDPVRRTTRDIVPSLIPKVRGMYIRELKEIWWAVASPLDGVVPSANNTVLAFDVDNEIWYKYILPIEAFGQYSRQTAYTWDTLPYATWDEWPGTWDGADGAIDWPIDLGGDTSGNTFELHGSEKDDGSAYEARMVITTDLVNKQALSLYKRMQGIEVIAKRGNADDVVTLSVRADGGAWEEIGNISLYDTTNPDYIRVRLPMDKRGRAFEVELSALCPLDWYGAIFDYVPAGEM